VVEVEAGVDAEVEAGVDVEVEAFVDAEVETFVDAEVDDAFCTLVITSTTLSITISIAAKLLGDNNDLFCSS
jgi:hypothetical protein